MAGIGANNKRGWGRVPRTRTVGSSFGGRPQRAVVVLVVQASSAPGVDPSLDLLARSEHHAGSFLSALRLGGPVDW